MEAEKATNHGLKCRNHWLHSQFCHPERSEAELKDPFFKKNMRMRILRLRRTERGFAQNDKMCDSAHKTSKCAG